MVAGVDDPEVIEQLRVEAARGDRRAMEQLLRQLEPLIMRRCARLLPNPLDAQEASQDALLAVSLRLGQFSDSGSFLGWVCVIAANSARTTYRSLRRRTQERATEPLPEPSDPRTTSVIAGTRLDLLEAIEQLEAAKPHLVEAFVLRDLAALPYEEVAARTGVPLGTVKAASTTPGCSSASSWALPPTDRQQTGDCVHLPQ